MIKLNILAKPLWNSTSAIIATIDEISMKPIGGMIFLNGSKNGSYIFDKNWPNLFSLALGIHDIKK